MMTSPQHRRQSLIRALRRRRSLRAGLVQFLYIAAGIGLGLLVPRADTGATIPSLESAALLAGTVAGLLALTGIVFALLFLVIQFAATAQSPRLHLFRDNPLVWHALGLVIGVIVYATTCVVVTANDPTTTILVPISVVVLGLLALALTRRLQLEALRSVQLSATLDQVTSQTREVIDRLYTAPFGSATAEPPAPPADIQRIRWPHAQGYLRQIDVPRLIRYADDADTTLRLMVPPGELVRHEAVVLEVWNTTAAPDLSLLNCLEVGIDRNFTQDPLLGFRLLNDIALRAMSTAINDPASAVQAVDAIEGLLTALVGRDLAVGVITDDNSAAPRVIFHAVGWEEFLAAGVDEIAPLPVHPMIRRRLRVMLDLLLSLAPDERHASIEQRLEGLRT